MFRSIPFLFLFCITASAQGTSKPFGEVVIEEPSSFISAQQPKSDAYSDAVARAARERKVLVIFAGVPARDVPGAVIYAGTADFDHKGRPGIIYRLRDGTGWRQPPEATDAEIQQIVREESSRPAFPFELSAAATADVERDRAELPHLTFLADLEQYTSAKRTQFSTRRWSGGLGSTSRFVLEPKWIYPGGLSEIGGWTSRLYKTRDVHASVFLVRQDPSDDTSTVTWGRSYPDVTFADVLRNDAGKIFEVRLAEKRDGQWERFVAYRAPQHRPAGYVPIRSNQCAGCHSSAGSSEYNGPAIPGADTVLSEPIPIVERGEYVSGGYGTRLN